MGFDLPLLEREFERAGVEFSRQGRQIVDSMSIFHMREPFNPPNSRNLAAAYQKFCGKELTGADSAESDVRASAEILEGQLEVYSDLPCDVDGLCSLCVEHRKAFIDIGGKLVLLENGEAAFNFGKHKGYTLRDIVNADPDYLIWILSQDFSPEVKDIITKALEGEYPKNT